MSTPEDSEARSPARRVTERVETVIFAGQLALGAVAVLGFAFWFLVAPSNEGYWYPEILALSIGIGVAAYLLNHL